MSLRETGLDCVEDERNSPRSVAGVKIIFVPLQSRSLHERGSAPKGFGFREVGCDNEIFEKLDI